MTTLSGRLELRWAYIAFGLLGAIDLLVAVWTVHHVVLNGEPVTADALLLLILLLTVHLLLLWLFRRIRTLLRLHRQLRDSYEEELHFARQLLECSGEGMIVLDAEGEVRYANSVACELLGYPHGEVVGHPMLNLIDPAHHQPIREQWRTSWGCQGQTYALQIRDGEGQLRSLRAVTSPRWHHGRIVGSFAALSPHSPAPVSAPAAGLPSVPVP
ncbi:PAS domain-containing protein [Deinococcus sp. VB343]|uniref:PAS domain-containing protein n=1 Tax=Deinococcus sp. VB142 TaxID=3112952 RepID=A0AAU6Q0S5_9DEIO